MDEHIAGSPRADQEVIWCSTRFIGWKMICRRKHGDGNSALDYLRLPVDEFQFVGCEKVEVLVALRMREEILKGSLATSSTPYCVGLATRIQYDSS